MLRNFYNQCDTFYVPSTSIMEELADEGIDIDLMKLWERGVDRNLFSFNKKKPELIRELTGNNNPSILFVSRLVWEKNLQTMIKLYELIEQRELKYNFIVIGDGIARDEVEVQMPNAFFLGHVEHERLANIYASSDVFFFPSITETFGNVVLEAMASGLPCVIADKGGSKDFIKDGYNGFKCSPYDASAYLDRIMKILENPRLAKQLSDNAIETSKKYVWENLALVYFNDLKTLAFELHIA